MVFYFVEFGGFFFLVCGCRMTRYGRRRGVGFSWRETVNMSPLRFPGKKLKVLSWLLNIGKLVGREEIRACVFIAAFLLVTRKLCESVQVYDCDSL